MVLQNDFTEIIEMKQRWKGTTVQCNKKNAINKLIMKLNVETVVLGLVVGSLGHVFCVYTNEYANVLVEIFFFSVSKFDFQNVSIRC